MSSNLLLDVIHRFIPPSNEELQENVRAHVFIPRDRDESEGKVSSSGQQNSPDVPDLTACR